MLPVKPALAIAPLLRTAERLYREPATGWPVGAAVGVTFGVAVIYGVAVISGVTGGVAVLSGEAEGVRGDPEVAVAGCVALGAAVPVAGCVVLCAAVTVAAGVSAAGSSSVITGTGIAVASCPDVGCGVSVLTGAEVTTGAKDGELSSLSTGSFLPDCLLFSFCGRIIAAAIPAVTKSRNTTAKATGFKKDNPLLFSPPACAV